MSWINEKNLAEKADALAVKAGEILTFAQSENRDVTPEEKISFEKYHAERKTVLENLEMYKTQNSIEKSIISKFVEEPKQKNESKYGNINDSLRTFALRAMGDNPETYGLTGGSTSGAELMTRLTSEVMVDVGQPTFGTRQMGYTVIPTSLGGSYPIPIVTDTSNNAYLLTVGTDVTFTADPATSSIDAKDYQYAVDILVSKFSVRDSAFPLAQYIAKASNERIEKLFNTHCTTGDGSAKPYGITTSTCSSLGHAAASTSAITADEVIRTIYALRADYRANAKIQCTSGTQLALMLLKDENDQYLWRNGSVATGQPDTFAGKVVVTNEAMAELSAGASSKVLLVTDPSFGYIREVVGGEMEILDQLSARKGMVDFLTIKSLGFAYTNTAASKWLALAAG